MLPPQEQQPPLRVPPRQLAGELQIGRTAEIVRLDDNNPRLLAFTPKQIICDALGGLPIICLKAMAFRTCDDKHEAAPDAGETTPGA